MSEQNVLRILTNWAIGAQLHDIRDRHKIIIKGHIFLDHMLKVISDKDSFYKKTLFLNTYGAKKELIELLLELNRIRNHIAHEIEEIDEEILNDWSEKVLSLYPSEYEIRKTKRTKIILAFTAISNQLFKTLYYKSSHN